MIAKVRNFLVEVFVELKKVSWPTKQELIDSTWIVVTSAFFIGIFIAATDFILARLLSVLIKQG